MFLILRKAVRKTRTPTALSISVISAGVHSIYQTAEKALITPFIPQYPLLSLRKGLINQAPTSRLLLAGEMTSPLRSGSSGQAV